MVTWRSQSCSALKNEAATYKLLVHSTTKIYTRNFIKMCSHSGRSTVSAADTLSISVPRMASHRIRGC